MRGAYTAVGFSVMLSAWFFLSLWIALIHWLGLWLGQAIFGRCEQILKARLEIAGDVAVIP